MVRLIDVATKANVNVATVSRVLNRSKGVERITQECIERVEAAAKELGYRANYLARSMKTGKSNAIGVVLPHSSGSHPLGWFQSAMLSGVQAGASGHDVHCVTITAQKRKSATAIALSFLDEGRVDGLIVPGGLPLKDQELLEAAKHPVVLLEGSTDSKLATVNLDCPAGMRLAVDHLADLGHKSILWFGLHKPSDANMVERRMAVEEQAAARGLTVASHDLPTSPDSALPAEIEHLRGEILPILREEAAKHTGVVCFNDIIAVSVYAAMQELALCVPDDLSVVGFDDLFAQTLYPALTTVSHMLPELANRSVDMILNLKNPSDFEQLHGRRELVAPELVIRKSTRNIP